MSIVTLKKKTQAKYNNMSVGSTDGFSLNGVYRNQGYVGQTTQSRSLPRTLMKGHGGCCGKYPIMPVVLTGLISYNDPKIVKPSVIGTEGMITNRFRLITKEQSCNVVKPDNNNHLNDQQNYIDRLHKKTVYEADKCSEIKKKVGTQLTHYSNFNGYCKQVKCDYTKDQKYFNTTTSKVLTEKGVSISGGEYVERLQNVCIKNDIYMFKENKQATPIVGSTTTY